MSILEVFKIDTIVDVRSIPYSKFASNYNKENIQAFLLKKKFNYIYMGDLLGGKGVNDIPKRWTNSDFLQGANRLKDGLNQNYTISLMCGEKNPQDCHRFRLIGEYLTSQNIDVLHIVPSLSNGYQSKLHQSFMPKQQIKQKILL